MGTGWARTESRERHDSQRPRTPVSRGRAGGGKRRQRRIIPDADVPDPALTAGLGAARASAGGPLPGLFTAPPGPPGVSLCPARAQTATGLCITGVPVAVAGPSDAPGAQPTQRAGRAHPRRRPAGPGPRAPAYQDTADGRPGRRALGPEEFALPAPRLGPAGPGPGDRGPPTIIDGPGPFDR